jgi:hypothetical protein
LLALLNHYGFTDRNIGHNSYSVGFPGVGGTSIYGQTLATTYGVVGRKDPYNFYEARGVQRYTLAQSAANGIDYITTGDLLSVKRLLESQADSAGPSGPQLVANKVKALWIVGGYWPSGTAVSDFGGSAARAAVSDYVLQNWPSSVPIYLVNILDGDTVTTGGSVMVALNSANPARVAWELYFARSNPADTRPGWSQIALLAIAFGLGAGYLQIADSGVASVNPTTGNTSFNPGFGNHHYLSKVMSDANFISTINSYLTDP